MNKILLSLWLFSLTLCVTAQEIESPHLRFGFRVGTSDIDPAFKENQLTLQRLDKVLAPPNSIYIKAIRVSSGASPEGSIAINRKLSSDRMYAINTLISRCNPAGTFVLTKGDTGIDWKGLRLLVETDLNTPRRKEILHIIDMVPEMDFARNISRCKSLMDLGVKPWEYLMKNHFPLLRSSVAAVIYLMPDTPQERIAHINAIIKGETTEIDLPAPVVIAPPIVTVPADSLLVTQSADTLSIQSPADTLLTEIEPAYRFVRPLAIKTNLLFDLATALNIEVEVPISPRWSIAGEWTFPWWLWEQKQHAFQLLQGLLEVRYWFKTNNAKQDPLLGKHNPLAGWFVGLYGSAGYYDFEKSHKGFQGDLYGAGISAGYTLPLSRNFNMEFSLGVGYLQTSFWNYEAKQDINNEWHLIRTVSGRISTFALPVQHEESGIWLLPYRAKVSFIWYPHFNSIKKKGGVK